MNTGAVAMFNKAIDDLPKTNVQIDAEVAATTKIQDLQAFNELLNVEKAQNDVVIGKIKSIVE